MQSEYIWLTVGVILVIVDTVHLGGVGLVFAGAGAITTGAILHLELIPLRDPGSHYLTFFIATVVWTAILWKPIQKLRIPKPGREYKNIIGDTAYVGSSGLNRKTGGEVTWSGTIMKAQLAPNVAVDTVEAGSQVEVVDVAGATLIVKPK